MNHEAVFYDPEALVEPIRIVRNYARLSDFDEGDPYVYIECIPTIYPVNGHSTPVTPGTVIEYEIPDMFGRPWASLWERHLEQDMAKPEKDDIFSFDGSSSPVRRSPKSTRRLQCPMQQRCEGLWVCRCCCAHRARSRTSSSPRNLRTR